MAEAQWIQLGVYPTFGLVVGGDIGGITYWVDAQALAQQAPQDATVPESGWYFVPVTRPWEPARVAQGLELSPHMTEEEVAETLEQALEVIANEVLAAGGGEG
jgi:hypothetical protein